MKRRSLGLCAKVERSWANYCMRAMNRPTRTCNAATAIASAIDPTLCETATHRGRVGLGVRGPLNTDGGAFRYRDGMLAANSHITGPITGTAANSVHANFVDALCPERTSSRHAKHVPANDASIKNAMAAPRTRYLRRPVDVFSRCQFESAGLDLSRPPQSHLAPDPIMHVNHPIFMRAVKRPAVVFSGEP